MARTRPLRTHLTTHPYTPPQTHAPAADARKKSAGLLKHPGGTPASAVPAARGGALPPLPAGWSSALDPGSGKEYFYSSDGQTAWERPT